MLASSHEFMYLGCILGVFFTLLDSTGRLDLESRQVPHFYLWSL